MTKEGVLLSPDGRKYAWSLRQLPKTERYAESTMFEVIQMTGRNPRRVCEVRAADSSECATLLKAFSTVAAGGA